ncbi:hypothetical protein UN65_01665 [Flavobacterium columnare]|uniref:Uncharacterized protein n=1 Tax=Flavobacterium columnare TaxID=996 RepID=A0AAI8GAA8_9FLAO|nr:hypothetical protein UN65_01665 [Flavobacterium columnare]QOG58505.1 hypothetical protein HUE29_01680 [Flavobacterium columnare]QOG61228.1 hypothetical protein HUE30_01680 [Flavobacterium columnare]QOG63950.1 hypothetical protein HUE31_01685 [Flavobacterium columnare]QOG66674.1 hypothetical protein HUE32_01685 [Flavobacterium columnare]
MAFLHCLIKPIDDVYYNWKQKRLVDWYKLNHNGQRCKLRKVLNDELDSQQRRIRIDDGTSYKRKYIYTKAESKPIYLGKPFINSKTEFENTGVDFVVYVPTEIVDKSIHKLKFLINYYKLAGKRYRIEKI